MVLCEEPDDRIGKIAYTMANPVEARLVRYGHSWPGLRRAWPAKPQVCKKPKKFFRGTDVGGKWPLDATLELARPGGYEELSDDELAAVVKSAIDEREDRFRAQYDAEGRGFLGRRRVLEQRRHSKPSTRREHFGISPKVACRNKWARIARLQANKQWLADHRTAFAQWRAGQRDVVFPHGTYKMGVLHGVHCAAPD